MVTPGSWPSVCWLVEIVTGGGGRLGTGCWMLCKKGKSRCPVPVDISRCLCLVVIDKGESSFVGRYFQGFQLSLVFEA